MGRKNGKKRIELMNERIGYRIKGEIKGREDCRLKRREILIVLRNLRMVDNEEKRKNEVKD